MEQLVKTLTKKSQVFEFIRSRVWVKTHELIAFGVSIYYNRADRAARLLAQEAEEYFTEHGYYPPEGYIRRMDENLKKLRFPGLHEDVWMYIEK